MKEIAVESFTMQSFVKSHNIRRNKWFNTNYNAGSTGRCTVLTADAEAFLERHGIKKMAAPGTETYNRWPMNAYPILEQMVDDFDVGYDGMSQSLEELLSGMKEIERSAHNVVEKIERMIAE